MTEKAAAPQLQDATAPKLDRAKAYATIGASGVLSNAQTVMRFSEAAVVKDVSTHDMTDALLAISDRLGDGDNMPTVRLLASQAASLNAIFVEMARRSAVNLGEYLDASEKYMRLALKAQNQCRATLETLAMIQNPPIVYARQANIAHGPQQVNNGTPIPTTTTVTTQAVRAGETETEQPELLEKTDGERLDFGAQGQAGGTDPQLVPVGKVHRPAN